MPTETSSFSAQAYDGDFDPVSDDFVWQIDNPKVATVNGMGIVSAIGGGSATVSAVDPSGRAGTSSVSVHNAAQVYSEPMNPVPDMISTSVTQTVVVTGCQFPVQNSSSTTTFATTERVGNPFFLGITSVPQLTNVFSLINGISEAQGSYSLNTTIPPDQNGGVSEVDTYKVNIIGSVITESLERAQSDVDTKAADVLTQNYDYKYYSSYDIEAGTQMYSIAFHFHQVETENPYAPGCVGDSVVIESGGGLIKHDPPSVSATP